MPDQAPNIDTSGTGPLIYDKERKTIVRANKSTDKTLIAWQPIDTLKPFNRQRVLASHWSGYYCDWVKDAEFKHGCWMDGLAFLTPTHWAPIPMSPTEFAVKNG